MPVEPAPALSAVTLPETSEISDVAVLSEVPELVPARMINEFEYCPRLFYLEWVQQRFEHNRYTVEGEYVHRVVDAGGGKMGDAEDDEPFKKAMSVELSSRRLGMIAKADIIEHKNGEVVPVEVKRGSPPRHGPAWMPDMVQICTIALLLRDNGYKCSEGQIYFASTRRRTTIPISDMLVAHTLQLVRDLRKVAASPSAPAPLVDSPKCPGCSLVGICLPDETNLHTGRSKAHPRRLTPRDSAARPVYVTEQGAKIGIRAGRVVVSKGRKKLQQIRMIDVSQIAIYGNVQISSQMMRAAFRENIPVCWFSYGGWFQGIAEGLPSKHVDLRRRQVAIAAQAGLPIAKSMIKGKLLNQRTFLRRNSRSDVKRTLAQLKSLADNVDKVETIESLLGVEGTGARLYFSKFATMIRNHKSGKRGTRSRGIGGGADAAGDGGLRVSGVRAGGDAHGVDSVRGVRDGGVCPGGEVRGVRDGGSRVSGVRAGSSRDHSHFASSFDFQGRNRRPPRDPVNCLLSYVYALLTKDLTAVALSIGLDPYMGVYHKARFGRPALALDLAEEFRPLVAESVVINVINNGEISPKDFYVRAAGVSLSRNARRAVLAAYERRLDIAVTHPTYGYKITYRRVYEVQARVLAAHLVGEIPSYTPFMTR